MKELNRPSSYDMTFCVSECDDKKCIRNFKYLYKPNGKILYSTAEMKDSIYCPKIKMVKK